MTVNMRAALGDGVDVLLAILLILVAPLAARLATDDPGGKATIVGAMIGAAAILFGNWVSRRNERTRAREADTARETKVKAFVTAELLAVMLRHETAKRMLDSALTSLQANGPVHDRLDMSLYSPRLMLLTQSNWAEVLILDQKAIDALVTLRTRLEETADLMNAITEGRERFGLLRITELAQVVRSDMEVLAEAFERIAPTRQVQLTGQQPELVSARLRRLGAERLPTDPEHPGWRHAAAPKMPAGAPE